MNESTQAPPSLDSPEEPSAGLTTQPTTKPTGCTMEPTMEPNTNTEPTIPTDAEVIERLRAKMALIKKNHSDCVPVYFQRHKQASESLPKLTNPFVLFRKDLKIEQAMYHVYLKVKQKGLQFFCIAPIDNQMKYIRLKTGSTVEEVFNRYGKDQVLTLIYADNELGLGGINKMQKILIRIVVTIAVLWLVMKFYQWSNEIPSQPL